MPAFLKTRKLLLGLAILAGAALMAAWAVTGRIAARDRTQLVANGTIEVRDIELSAPRAAFSTSVSISASWNGWLTSSRKTKD